MDKKTMKSATEGMTWSDKISLAANFCTVVGAGVAVFLYIFPGIAVDWAEDFKAIALENNRISEATLDATKDVATSTDIIAQSLPKWPKISALRFEYEYPKRAHFLLGVENLRNVEIENFQAQVRIESENGVTPFEFGGRHMFLPYEDFTLVKDATREPWIERLYLSDAEKQVVLCLRGKISGENSLFYEHRRYDVSAKGAVSDMLERSFSSEIPHESCK